MTPLALSAETPCGKEAIEQVDSTLVISWAVPRPNTNRAMCRLTSEVERDPMHSTCQAAAILLPRCCHAAAQVALSATNRQTT